MPFDPDAYLADKASVKKPSFDPDAYLGEKPRAGGFDPDAYLAQAQPAFSPAPPRSMLGNVGAALARGVQTLPSGLLQADRMMQASPIQQLFDPRTVMDPVSALAKNFIPKAIKDKVDGFKKGIADKLSQGAQTGWEAPRAPVMDEALRGKIEQINQKYLAENRLGSEEHANEINDASAGALWRQAPVTRAAEVIAEGVPSYAAAILATLTTKNPLIGGVILGAQQGGSTFADAEAAGESTAKAALLGQLDMAWSTVSEKIPFEGMLGRAGEKIIERILKGGGTEAIQELVQNVGSNVIAKLGWDHGRALMQGWLESLVGGAGLGAAGGAMIGPSSAPTAAPIPGVAESDQAQAKELVAGGLDPATVAAWSQAPDEATKQQILTDALKPPASEQPIGEPTALETPPPANNTVASAPPPLPGAAAQSPEADALQAMTEDISRTRKPVPPDQFSVVEPPPERADEVSAVNQATTLLGKKVVWFKNNKPENLRLNGATISGDTIFLNIDSKQPYVKVAMHETLHRMKTEQADLYGKFMAVVKTEGSGFDQFRDELLSAYKGQGIAVDESSDWVWEELAADTIGDRGQDPTFWRDLYNKSPEAVQAIVDTIQKVISTLSGQAQTPEVAKYFKDFQKVHDAAVSVMSEYAAARSTDASLTQQGSPAVSIEAAAISPTSKNNSTKENFNRLVTKSIQDDLDASRGQSILDQMEESGESPRSVVRQLYETTYDLLPPEIAEKFDRYAEKLGWPLPPNLDRSPKAIGLHAVDDFPDRADELEGINRGFVALAKMANERVKSAHQESQPRAALPASKKAAPSKPADTTKTNPQLDAWRDEVRSSGIRPDPVINEADMGGTIEPGVIRKGARQTWDGALQNAVNMGLISEDEASQPNAFQRLFKGENTTVKDAEAAESKAMIAKQEGELIDALKRGETVDEQAFKDFPAAEKFKDYGKTKDRPATVGGLEAYHDGKAWKARKPGGEFKKVEGAIAARLDAAMPGVAEDKVPFSIDRVTQAEIDQASKRKDIGEMLMTWHEESLGVSDDLRSSGSRSSEYRDSPGSLDDLSRAKQRDFILWLRNIDGDSKTPLSIDDDLLAEFEKQFPEPEPARPKLAKRILDDPEYTEDAKNFAKSLVKEVRGLEEDASVAGEFIDAEGHSVALAKVIAKRTGLKDSQAAVVAQMLHKTYDRLIRVAEKEGKPEEAREIARMNDELGAFITEQQQEGGRLTNAWKYNLTTASWDTASGMSATFEGMVERSNAKHPEIKTVKEQLDIAQATIQQVAKEAADKALSNEALKSTIAAKDAEIETMKRRDALLAKQDKAGFESWDRNPARYKSLNDQLDAEWNSPDELAGKFAEGAKLSIESTKAKLAVDPAKYLDTATSEKLTKRTQAWIWQQKKVGKEYGFKEWRAWAESTYGKGLFNFDDANDIHKTATRLMGRAATMTEKGKRAPKLETMIRRGIKASGFSINEIVYQTVTQQGATLKTLTERLVNELGYSATDAADLAVKINSEFRNIVSKRGQQMLEAKFRDRGTKPRGRTKNVLDDILKSIRLGALSDADIKAKLYDKYGLTTVSPEAEAKFVELAAKVAEETDKRYNAAKAKGYTDAQIAMQDDSVGMRTAKEASAKFMASQVKHGLNDYAWSWVHFSLLSSPYTWLFNTVANNSQLLGITTARALQGIVKAPFDRGRTLRQLSYGLSEMIGATPGAFAEAYNTMVTGEGVIRGNDKFDSDPSKYNVFESSEFLNKHPVLKAPLVFVRRILQAGDIVSAMQLRELQSAMMTASIAQSEGLTGVKLSERVAEMMGHSPLNMKKYESMADAEGLTGINRFRRINQLVENNRAQDIRENASVFSAWHTFNSQMPRGFIGDAAMVLNNFALRNQDHPILGIPARSMGLFVRISANVSNIILDYSPYGFERARRGKVRLSNGKTYEMNDLYEGLRADVVTQATIGTAIMVRALVNALFAFAKWKEDPDKDKKNPDFSVYGPGPSDTNLRQVWMEAGGRPWSIQFGNGNAIPYKWAAPVAIPLALVGLWMDGERFKKEDEPEDSRVWRMTGGMAVGMLQYIMQQSPMTAMNSAFRAVNGFGGKDEENRFRKYIAGFTGFAIPNFISWIDKSMDPTVYSANDWLSAFTKNIPFVRGNALVPSLNLFGEPIEYAPSERFLGDAKSDPEMMWLTNNNLGIAKPDRPYMVDYKTGKQHQITEEEYYKLIKHFGPRFREALRFAIPRMNNLGHKDKMENVTKIKKDAYEYAKFMLYKESGLQAETKEKAEDVQDWFDRKNSRGVGGVP